MGKKKNKKVYYLDNKKIPLIYWVPVEELTRYDDHPLLPPDFCKPQGFINTFIQ